MTTARPARRGPRLSLSTRTTLWYGSSLLLLLSLFAAFLYGAFHVVIHQNFDHHLIHEQRQLRPYIALTDPRGPVFRSGAPLQAIAYRSDDVHGIFVRLIEPTGRVRYQSPNFGAHPPWPVATGAESSQPQSFEWQGKPLRVHLMPLLDGQGQCAGWLEVAGFEWSLHQELHHLRNLMILGIAVSVLLAMLGGFLLTRRALHPIVRLTQTVRTLGERDLAVRLPVGSAVQDEVSELAQTFNEMLSRLEAAFHRERRFTADAAHELMTPLTILQNEVDVTLRRRRESEEYAQSLREVQTDLRRLSHMVHRLLSLSRSDARQDGIGAEPVDLSRIVAEQLALARKSPLAEERLIEASVADEQGVCGDAVQLAEVVANLLDNALKYTPPGGTIGLRLEPTDGGTVQLAVSDSGIGFDPADAARLAERFYRSDRAEVQSQPGTGLGLAIVEAIVRAHGGHLTATSAGPDRGSRFTVILPISERV